jgi:hypothetical protein
MKGGGDFPNANGPNRVLRSLGLMVAAGCGNIPTMIVTLDAKRRFSIPAKLAPANPGDQFASTSCPSKPCLKPLLHSPFFIFHFAFSSNQGLTKIRTYG